MVTIIDRIEHVFSSFSFSPFFSSSSRKPRLFFLYVKMKLLLSPFFLFPFFPFFSFSRFLFGVRGKKRRHKKIQSTLFLCVVGRSSVVVRVSLSLSVSNARALFALCSFSFSLSRSTEERRGKGEKREFHGKTFFSLFGIFLQTSSPSLKVIAKSVE